MRLYKFQTINDNSLSALKSRRLWCSKASKLNDPFELRVIKYGTETQHFFAGLNGIQIVDTQTNLPIASKEVDIHQVMQSILEQLDEQFGNIGVISFSEEEAKDELLM